MSPECHPVILSLGLEPSYLGVSELLSLQLPGPASLERILKNALPPPTLPWLLAHQACKLSPIPLSRPERPR